MALSVEHLFHEPQRLFGTAPGEGHARSPVAVVVDAGDPAVFSFQAYLGPARPESYPVLQYFSVCQARLKLCAATQDACGGLRVWMQVPLALLGRTAQDAVT